MLTIFRFYLPISKENNYKFLFFAQCVYRFIAKRCFDSIFRARVAEPSVSVIHTHICIKRSMMIVSIRVTEINICWRAKQLERFTIIYKHCQMPTFSARLDLASSSCWVTAINISFEAMSTETFYKIKDQLHAISQQWTLLPIHRCIYYCHIFYNNIRLSVTIKITQ